MKSEMPDVEPDVRQTAVSVYGSDAMDDFIFSPWLLISHNVDYAKLENRSSIT